MPSANRLSTLTAVPAVSAAGTRSHTRPDVGVAAANLIRFLETGTVPDGLFAPSVFADLSLPHWRLQAEGDQDVIALRTMGHPFPGRVRVERVEQTDHGFVIEFEERWHHDGQDWYCREAIRADVDGDSIVEMSIYCTGDWDEAVQKQHASEVQLIRP